MPEDISKRDILQVPSLPGLPANLQFYEVELLGTFQSCGHVLPMQLTPCVPSDMVERIELPFSKPCGADGSSTSCRRARFRGRDSLQLFGGEASNGTGEGRSEICVVLIGVAERQSDGGSLGDSVCPGS
jgi:hypothetical protein